ncbi:MAG: hypothetical protein AB2708_14355, partial [Candidatus Thiodiazotropha taylori]
KIDKRCVNLPERTETDLITGTDRNGPFFFFFFFFFFLIFFFFLKVFEKKEIIEYKKVISRSSALFSLAGIIGALGSIFLGYPILLLYGENYTASYLILILLTIANISFIFFGPVAVIMSMTNLQKQRAYITMVSAGLLVVFSYYGAVLFNATGVALGVVIAMWANNGLLSYVIWKKHNVKSGLFSRDALNYYTPEKVYSLLDAQTKHLKSK